MKIFNVGDHAVNQYLLVSKTHRLLIDSGFPGSINKLGREMRKTGFKLSEIDFLIVTHFHVDHAGAIQELKNQNVKFVLFEVQEKFIRSMEDMTAGKWSYTPLKPDDNIVLSLEKSRGFLQSIGISGEVASTPGHSDDSISLILDSGECFIGDLYAEHLLTEKDFEQKQSWLKLKQAGVKEIFPGHGSCYKI